MVFDGPTLTRLLGSIEANRLVLLCGAGLSIPSPSDLMSAVQVSRVCYDKYLPINALPAVMRDQVDQIASYFWGTGEFESVFIGSLVPWDDLVGQSNSGHAAVADLLICRAAHSGLTANFDFLIEQWASERKVYLRGALDGLEAMAFRDKTSPLVKFHGCMVRGLDDTLWTDAQRAKALIANRIESCSQWMRLELPGKDLLIIGFWTDWGYLNDLLATAMDIIAFGSVTIVDLQNAAALQRKAPNLWAALSRGTANFINVEASSAEALDELRGEFSRVWLERFYALAQASVTAAGLAYTPLTPAAMIGEDRYKARCDAEGVPYNRAAQTKHPPLAGEQAAFFHHLLTVNGATADGAWYIYNGRRIRIVQGSGEYLASIRARYREPPTWDQPDIVVCAGASDVRLPSRIIGTGVSLSIVRPGPSARPLWLTAEQARIELGI